MEERSTDTISASVAETERLAGLLAQTLRPGACIGLDGELGAGKTQFVRGLVRGLGGHPRHVSSPTFILLNVYQTPRLVVYHLDAYRVTGPEDLEAIGFLELLEQQGVAIVEWASRVEGLLPPDALRITLAHHPLRATARLIRGLPQGIHGESRNA